MTSLIEQSELSTELQELHLKGKQWISDLNFQKTEMIFVQDLIAKTNLDPGSLDPIESGSTILEQIEKIAAEESRIRLEILTFMTVVGQLSTTADPDIENTLISTYVKIEADLFRSAEIIHNLKMVIFKMEKDKI